MKKKPRPAKSASAAIDASNDEILDAALGFRRLLAVKFPVVLTFALKGAYHTLKFAATLISETADDTKKRFYKKDRKGRPIYGENTPDGQQTILLTDPEKCRAELAALGKLRQRLNVTPLKRSEIPEKVDGKAVVIEGEVWELLGPFLVD